MFDEFLDVPRFSGQTYVQTFVTYLREKYASHPIDVVVVAGGDALRFLLDNRAELFARAPAVHMGVSQEFLRSISPLPADVIGVPVQYNFSDTIDQALRWHPRARRVVVVTGTAVQDRLWEARLREDAYRFKDRATAQFLTGLTTNAVQNRLKELGGDAVVFTPGYFQDGAGRYVTPRESIELMAAVATAPIYGPFDTFMGTGIVGGWMPNFEAMGRQAGQTVNALLEGSGPAATRLPETMPNTLNVVRALESRERPADAVVHFKTPTFLEAYRIQAIITAFVILLQAGLIGSLLVEHYRRRLAEQSVQKQRFELAHASRLTMAGELTGSIAHEN